MQDDHIPVPIRHVPNVKALQQTDDSLTMQEQGNSDGHIIAEDPSGWVEVTQ